MGNQAKSRAPDKSSYFSLRKAPVNKKPIIVVGLNISKSSVVRNRIKRQIREELIQRKINNSPLFLLVHPGAERLPSKKLREELRMTLNLK